MFACTPISHVMYILLYNIPLWSNCWSYEPHIYYSMKWHRQEFTQILMKSAGRLSESAPKSSFPTFGWGRCLRVRVKCTYVLCKWSSMDPEASAFSGRGTVWVGRHRIFKFRPFKFSFTSQLLELVVYCLKELQPRLYCLFLDKNLEWQRRKYLLVTQVPGNWMEVCAGTSPKRFVVRVAG